MFPYFFCHCITHLAGPGVAQWLRRCATSQTVAGSIPGGVTGLFSDIVPFDRTVALGSTQPLVKMSTRNIPGCKGSQCVRLTTSQPSRAECHEIWEPKPPGTLWATPGLLRDCFTFTLIIHHASFFISPFNSDMFRHWSMPSTWSSSQFFLQHFKMMQAHYVYLYIMWC